MGWTSVPNPDDYGNFEQGWSTGTLPGKTGTKPASLIEGLEASLRLLTGTGIRRIQDHLETLTDHFCERLRDSNYQVLSSRRPGEKSQIICIRNTSG